MLNFEEIYEKKILGIIDKVLTLIVIPEPRYMVTEEYKYFMTIKDQFCLVCMLFIANEKNLEDEFIKNIKKTTIVDDFDEFISHYNSIKTFIEEFWLSSEDITYGQKIVEKVDLINYIYNVNYYHEFKDNENAMFLESMFYGALQSIKIIFSKFS